jgi:DivIVA domain-containing protein
MAISFSRPDPSSPAAVGAASFPVARRGFDQGEVRDFLRMVAAELARLQERERFLETEMRAMQTRGMSSPGRLDEETVTTLLGEEAARVLSTARDASSQIRERAEESATRLVKDAAEDASRIRESATLEAQRIRDDAAADAEAEIEMAKQQGRDMVNEAREYREKVLSELSRRRDAARAQIEQLLHGRDRLLSAFERARLASEDVINGLTEAHDEPEFIVNLASVTGPIPVINPDHPSVGVFDRENEDVPSAHAETPMINTSTDLVIEEPVVVDEVVEEIVAEIFDHAVEVEEIEADEIAEHALDEVVVAIGETESEYAIADELIDSDEPATSDEPTASSEVIDSEDQIDSDEQNMSNVVSLFGRERTAPSLPEVEEVQAEADDIEEIAAVDDIEQVAEPAEVANKVDTEKVNDIFARLRADSTSKVAAAASAIVTPKPSKRVANPALFATRDEALAPLVVQFSRKLKRVLADEQNNVLEHLRKKRSSLEIGAVLGTVEEQAQRYCDAIADEMMKAATEGAKSMKAFGGSSRRITTKDLNAVVITAIAESLVAKFRDDTRIAIGEAEGDRDILASLMRDVYRQWKMSSLDEHVDDVACAAFSCGAYFSLESGAQITWIVSPTEGCCADCDDNALAVDVVIGADFPTGHRHPLAHAGCRCLVCPISH